MKNDLSIDIIIPVYRDTRALQACLSHPPHRAFLNLMTVVLAETDPEAEALCKEAGVRCLQAPSPGRAQQMNHAAEATMGDILLFLHADTRLPPTAIADIKSAIKGGAVGGAFNRSFDDPSGFLRFTCWLAAWRVRWFGWILGDQALFVRRGAFVALDGFPEWPQFEDLEFSRRLRPCGKTVLLAGPILSSARRFQKRGPLRQTIADFKATLYYWIRGKP